ncbi:unnamed protein product [Heligmosomoides polygyrus]|uniref:Flocculation protein FLO11-like n=1 Tax=Heligmosomoides polygyrus TaxID=6339 RepID=A0A183F768_HELPZ|nr:unnamed protein product [Heligmosomoides polygyrus]
MFLKVEIEVIRPSERMMIKRPSPSEMSTAVVSDTELQSSAVAASRAQTPLSKALAPSNPQSPRAHTPNGPKEPVPSPMEPAPVPVVINVENGTPDSPAKEKQRPKA